MSSARVERVENVEYIFGTFYTNKTFGGENMAKTLRMIEIVSDVEHLDGENILPTIREHTCIDKYIYILHDKDIKQDGTPKNPHYHIYLHFNAPQHPEKVCDWFGVAHNFWERIHGTFGDAESYAIHENAPDKHQYDISECITNLDIQKDIEKNKQKKAEKMAISEILTGIESGEIKEYNLVTKVTLSDYVKYERQIKRAFDYKLKELESRVDRKMNVLYLYGGSGCGKSTYAKMLAESHGYTPFISSGSNDPFDGYKGQECVILDDLRGSVFPLSDLFKILDNNTNSSVKARYKNISLQCSLLIITTTKTPDEFYRQVFESRDEEYKQFLRRCSQIGAVTKDFITFTQYNSLTSRHEFLFKIENPVKQLIPLCSVQTGFDSSFFKVSDSVLDNYAEKITGHKLEENDGEFVDFDDIFEMT